MRLAHEMLNDEDTLTYEDYLKLNKLPADEATLKLAKTLLRAAADD